MKRVENIAQIKKGDVLKAIVDSSIGVTKDKTYEVVKTGTFWDERFADIKNDYGSYSEINHHNCNNFYIL